MVVFFSPGPTLASCKNSGGCEHNNFMATAGRTHSFKHIIQLMVLKSQGKIGENFTKIRDAWRAWKCLAVKIGDETPPQNCPEPQVWLPPTFEIDNVVTENWKVWKQMCGSYFCPRKTNRKLWDLPVIELLGMESIRIYSGFQFEIEEKVKTKSSRNLTYIF